MSRHALNQAGVVFANGETLGELSKALAPRARIHPIYLGVDPAKFVPLPAAPSPVVIICTRGFEPVYNNSYLIQALALLPKSLPDFRVVFPSAGALLSETRELADKILSPELRRRVHFLNGVTDEDLLHCLQSAHIYTSVSRSDGTSISLLEALSCGLFPVLSDIPPNREWIDHKVGNGMLVPLDRPEEYALQLTEAILASAQRNAVSPFNRELILERADSRKTMARVACLLEDTIRPRNCS
jgi:glycosyltransferase involved in cell wall biosynthesis